MCIIKTFVQLYYLLEAWVCKAKTQNVLHKVEVYAFRNLSTGTIFFVESRTIHFMEIVFSVPSSTHGVTYARSDSIIKS